MIRFKKVPSLELLHNDRVTLAHDNINNDVFIIIYNFSAFLNGVLEVQVREGTPVN